MATATAVRQDNKKIVLIPDYSYRDYVAWEGRWELIEGMPFAMSPSPSLRHQRMSSLIEAELEERLKDCKECKAFLPIDWKVSEKTILQPDNCVICDFDLNRRFITSPPVMIFEILSPKTRKKDTEIKFRIYEDQGVKYFIIIKPLKLTALIYEIKDGKYVLWTKAENGSFNFDIGYCEFSFDFNRIFDEFKR